MLAKEIIYNPRGRDLADGGEREYLMTAGGHGLGSGVSVAGLPRPRLLFATRQDRRPTYLWVGRH